MFINKRTLTALMLAASALVFGALELLPGNAAQVILGETATPEAIAALAREMGINRTTVYYHFDSREALIEALRAGRLGGVAMDIHYQEPVADDDELLSFGNVVLTPRMAGSPRHNGLKDFEQLITGLAREIRL